ncbi:AMP-binding protein [Portibacter lacus]|uniref:Long-chain acyl-CoA synthetase n=1 Tax=Portibacter lacus TaxID=1099794 RepID=A0AA37SKF1_9BACT|nr:AMP-binding protein [Portibacter lacus]GLR16208.1 long-chain acyl-CoA synthetase [Portibacter lacus]
MPTLEPIINDFYKMEKSSPNEVFLRQPDGGVYTEYTWGQVGEIARKFVNVLRSKGLVAGDHIALSSKNCCHWIMADLALMMGGYVSVPLYANLNNEQLNVVLKKSDAKLLIAGKLDEWDDMSKGVPESMPVIKFPQYQGNAVVDRGENWDDLIAQAEPMQGDPLPEMDALWTILFTSGTTGTPKGVMLNHRHISVLIDKEREEANMGLYEMTNPKYFSFLPLNHIAERVLVEIAAITSGGSISFAESLDTFVDNLNNTNPTLFFAVPRIWTKFQQGVNKKMDQKKLDLLLKIPIISGIIKKKIINGLGLGNTQIFLTAAAPTPVALKRWYAKLGINLKEIYGMTETCGGITLMPKNEDREGTVGKAIGVTQVKLDPETGEIISKAPWNMAGYYKEEEKTKDVLKDGWVYTGDKGVMDEDGFLKIVGRTTDTFKSSKGKYILPVPIEDKLLNSGFIEQICLVGLGLPQPLALINLSEAGKSASRKDVEENLTELLVKVNGKLESYKKVSSFVITKDDWTIGNKLITPTLKVRRGFIHDMYKDKYDDWSQSGDKVIFE